MSDRTTTKPTPTVTVATLNNEADIAAAFSALGNTIVDNFPGESPHPVLKELYESLAIVACHIVAKEPEENRLAKVAELLGDYKDHLTVVGYEARLEDNLMVIGPVMLDRTSTFHRLNPEGVACVTCGKPIGAISELVEECSS